jgi:hypothetical protein
MSGNIVAGVDSRLKIGRAGARPIGFYSACCCLALTAVIATAGCADSTNGYQQAADAASPATSTGVTLQAQVVASQLTVGLDRVPIGLLDHNTPVTDALVHVRAFDMTSTSSQPKAEADAPFRGGGLEGLGLYVAQLRLDTPGPWLAAITVQRPGAMPVSVPAQFRVLAAATVPAVGQPAPRSHNPTLKDVPDVSYIDSGNPPDDMHSISIADAIAQQRPTLVVFATPAFCESATCGPQVHAVQSLEHDYRDRLTFIHVEIYRDFKPDPSKRQLTNTVLEWHLQTEPWVFLIDARGVINAAFEASTATDELRQAVDLMLAAH